VKGAPLAIGSPAAGCLQGAASLPPDGEGFRVVRISRKRFYGHPRLLDAIRDVGGKLRAAKGGTLLVSDLSMPRGGPMTGAHGSHQTGLDADVWLTLAESYGEGGLSTLDARENLPARKVPEGRLGDGETEMVRLFASHPAVDRLFVAPAVKRDLCSRYPAGEDGPWLRKVRPWYGHEDHLHLRAACPGDSPGCVPGKPLPEGNGCDDSLAWWFGDEAKATAAKPPERKEPVLPDACAAVLSAPEWP
jgi:penicillin-insensitive murein endopeptidase